MFRIRFFIVKNPRLKKIFRQRRWICELRINLNEERHVWQIILATTRCLKITEKSLIASKRATFTFWVDKSWLKMPKMVHFGEFLKTSSLWSMRLTRQFSFNETKNGGKCQNTNATFWVIFKQCEKLDIVHLRLLCTLEYPKSNVIFAMFVYFLLILNSGYSIWIFGFRKKQRFFLKNYQFLPHQKSVAGS